MNCTIRWASVSVPGRDQSTYLPRVWEVFVKGIVYELHFALFLDYSVILRDHRASKETLIGTETSGFRNDEEKPR